MGREACHTLPQILPCKAPSRREAPLPVPSGTLHSKKRAFVQEDKSSFFVSCEPYGSIFKLVAQNRDPATRSRCRSEETPRPAKRPRCKAGARAKRGVSELCHVNTIDQLPNLEYKPAIQRSDCGFERRKTFAVEMNALARSSDIQRSFLSVFSLHYR